MSSKTNIIQLNDDTALYHTQKTEQLTFGYLRQIQDEEISRNVIIPKEISSLCFKYVHNTTAYFGICDTSHSKIELIRSKSNKNRCPYNIYQKLSGKELINEVHKSVDIIFLSLNGFKTGCHEFNFQCIATHPNDKIGIVSVIDINNLKQSNFGKICLYHNVFGYRYFWWRHSHYIWKNHTNYASTFNHQQWKTNDFIKMRLNCDEWTLQFFLNGTKITTPLNIHKKTKYYPAVALGFGSSIYNYSLDSNVKWTDNQTIRHKKYHEKQEKGMFKKFKKMFSNK